MNNKLTKFYIVRHGNTEWNEKKLIQGIKDSSLTEKGIKQAEEVGEKLKNINFDLMFSSDLLRAKRTAEIITLEKKLEIETTKLLRERAYGKLEGKPQDNFKEWDKAMKKLTDEEKYEYRHIKNAETDKEVTERFFTFIREIAVRYPGKMILAVTHGGIMRMAITKLGLISYSNKKHGIINNGSYFVLETDGTDFEIKETNGLNLN